MTFDHTNQNCDIVVFGTGQFAARIVFDLAATTPGPLDVLIVGRNPERLRWLVTAANARAFMFDSPSRFRGERVDVSDSAAVVDLMKTYQPRLAVQTASAQPSAVIGMSGNAWSSLVADGGLSVTAATQAQLSVKVGEAINEAGIDCALINCCFPDVVNGLLKARGIDVMCGTGNVAILSNAFSGSLADRGQKLQVLAHYQQLEDWRKPAGQRSGLPPRVWIDQEEVGDVYSEFSQLKLTREPAIEISGASGVTLMQAFIAGRQWSGHAPGPNGLPGGYPVRLNGETLEVDLPPGLSIGDAVGWNEAFEENCGLVVDEHGTAKYTGKLKSLLKDAAFPWAGGFHVSEIETVGRDLETLRAALEQRPPAP